MIKSMLPLSQRRLAAAKHSFVTRRVVLDDTATLNVLGSGFDPKPGDIMLAQVLDSGGELLLDDGTLSTLSAGDEVIVAGGHRDELGVLSAHAPDRLRPCRLVSASGVIARLENRHRLATTLPRVKPLGLVSQSLECNLRDYTLSSEPQASSKTVRDDASTVLALVSSFAADNSLAALERLVDTLRKDKGTDRKIGIAHLTGIIDSKHCATLRRINADAAVNFSDAGYASTYRLQARELEALFVTLTSYLRQCGVDTILVLMDNGLAQPENAALLRSRLFRLGVNGVYLSAADGVDAEAGKRWLREHGLTYAGPC